MTPIAIATEDELSEAVALRLVAELPEPCYVTHRLRKNGFGYLRSKMDSWRQMAMHQVVLVLTDLDQLACPLALRDDWAGKTRLPQRLLLRIAVRDVEAWALADHKAMRHLVGTKGVLPPLPDALPDPKQVLLKLAKGAPKDIRADLLRNLPGGAIGQGLGYNARLVSWVSKDWEPARAAERSPSLARARKRLREAVAPNGSMPAN
ncbi:MAG: hypothetical protein M1430_08175 [Betaproteobacteria bacterium]|nr:hypothetical protein [Betaproteobacteria bacterium]